MRRSNCHLANLLLALYVLLCGPRPSEGNEDDLRKACSTIFHEPEINGAALRFNFSFGGALRPRRQLLTGNDNGAGLRPPEGSPTLFPPPRGVGRPQLPPGGGAGGAASPPFSCFLVFAVGPAKARVRGSRILVQVSDLRLPPGSKCAGGAGDAVRVYSVLRGRLFLVREFCERDNYYPAIVTESHMAVVTITFSEVQSDRIARGFNLKVEAYTNIFGEAGLHNLSDKLTGPEKNQSGMYDTMKKPEDKEHEWNLLSQQSWGSEGFHPYVPSRPPVHGPLVDFHEHGSAQSNSMYQSTGGHQQINGFNDAIGSGVYQPQHSSGHGTGHLNNQNMYQFIRPPKIKEDPQWNVFEEHHSQHSTNGHLSSNTWSPIRDQIGHTESGHFPAETWSHIPEHSGQSSHGGLHPITWSPIRDPANLNDHRPSAVQHGTLDNSWHAVPNKKPTWGSWGPQTESTDKKPQGISEWSTFNTQVPGRPSNSYLPPHTSSSHGHWNTYRPQKIQQSQPPSSWSTLSNEIADFSHSHWDAPRPQKVQQDQPPSSWSTQPNKISDVSHGHWNAPRPLKNQQNQPTSSWSVLSNEIPDFSHSGHWKKPENNKQQQWSEVNAPIPGRPSDHYLPPTTWSPVFHHSNIFNSHYPENEAQGPTGNTWDSNSHLTQNRELSTKWRNGIKWSSAQEESENSWKGFI